MASLTDPARELAEIAARFSTQSSLRADQVIFQEVGFDAWSTNFYRLLTCIHERADIIIRALPSCGLDIELVEQANQDLATFKSGFFPAAIRLAGNQAGSTATVMQAQGRSLQYLSPVVRQIESYPRYTDEEVSEFVDLIDRLLEQYSERRAEADFLEMAVEEGLRNLKFRLENVSWLGSGYALRGLREAMTLYDRVSRDEILRGNPDAEAFVKGFAQLLKRIGSVVKEAKDSSELVKFAMVTGSNVASYLVGSGHLLLPPN